MISLRLDYQFEITSISPDTGSIAGGTEVTLTGIGLVENMTVTLDGRDYLVTNVSEEGTQGTFFTGPSKETIQIKNDGGHPGKCCLNTFFEYLNTFKVHSSNMHVA